MGDTGSFPLRYLVDGSKKATPRLNLTLQGKLVGTVHLEIQQIKRNQPANKPVFEPGSLKITLKEALLLTENDEDDTAGNLFAKVEFQQVRSYRSKVSRTFQYAEIAPKVMHVWNEEYEFEVKQKEHVANMIRITLFSEDRRGSQ